MSQLTGVERTDVESGDIEVIVDVSSEPPLKRQRVAVESGAMFARHLSAQVIVKQEKFDDKQKEFDDKQDEYEDEHDEHKYQRAFALKLQDKVDELAAIARAAGGDAAAINAICSRH